MKKKNLLKSLAVALSISLLAPFANKVSAQETNIQTPEIIGEAAVTMDINTGEIIYSKNADLKLSPASTTKLMTALLFAENKSKSDTLTFSDTVVKVTETSLNNYKAINPGDKISAEDTMKAVMIFSANDTAYLMAESVGGTVDNFITMMNDKAAELGLKNTHFVNPSGLEIDPLNPSNTEINQTTAYDLAQIGIAAFKNDWVRETMAPKSGEISVSLSGTPIIIESRNKLLGKNGNIGGKTGTEEQAGHCFVGFYERDGRDLVTVVLKSEYGATGLNVFEDTEKLANYSYSAPKEIYKNAGDEIGTVDLTYKSFRFFGPEKQITAPIVVNEDVEYYKNDFNDKNATLSYNGDVKDAWKLSGNKEVKLTFSTPGHTEDVLGMVKLSSFELIKANLPIYLLSLLIIVIILVLILFIVRIINMKKRKRRRYY
ncbi:D-alanyl-D-alanine carboxypeptidase family protein [Clostridium tertium]|uniref:D-alanyl-D-alanine carboxypeptidase family protein n=1 Tax=Clostridium tertium TaxID=1559 RepID=UPI002A839A8A|nr:D-alanyl-D-alanine carboxypeptidase family protein [Clostridium tertium]MDY4604053.1 D-alanyl-D-alanine carboxypeptidase family protein [Clostridium tertium]